MAAPVVVASATDAASSDTDTSLAPALTPTAGELLVAFGFLAAVRTMSPPSGWTQVLTAASADYRGYVWAKVAAGSDDLTFTASGTFGAPSVAVMRLSGATATLGDLVSGSAVASGNDNNPACPSVTTVSADNLVLSLEGSAGGMSATCSGPTELYDTTGSPSGSHVAGYAETQASAGATTARTVTTSGFSRWVAATVAVPPGGGGGGGSNTTVTPAVATLTTTAFAPTVTVSDNQTVVPGVRALALTTFAPTVTTTANQTVTPSALPLTITTFAPTVTASGDQTVTPSTAALVLTTYAPTVSATSSGGGSHPFRSMLIQGMC